MRASEALLLGQLTIKSVPFTRNDQHGGGCALGMIDVAAGEATQYKYPWVMEPILACPCGHTKYEQRIVTILPGGLHKFGEPETYHIHHIYQCIVHIFNEHVCLDKTWTIERLAEWLDSVDPTLREQKEEVICEPAKQSYSVV